MDETISNHVTSVFDPKLTATSIATTNLGTHVRGVSRSDALLGNIVFEEIANGFIIRLEIGRGINSNGMVTLFIPTLDDLMPHVAAQIAAYRITKEGKQP